MEQKQQFFLWFFIVAFVAMLLIQNYFSRGHVSHLPDSEFKILLAAGKVDNKSHFDVSQRAHAATADKL